MPKGSTGTGKERGQRPKGVAALRRSHNKEGNVVEIARRRGDDTKSVRKIRWIVGEGESSRGDEEGAADCK
jgi:hypothetical protein